MDTIKGNLVRTLCHASLLRTRILHLLPSENGGEESTESDESQIGNENLSLRISNVITIHLNKYTACYFQLMTSVLV